MSDEVSVQRWVAKAVFDLIVNSADFQAGWLTPTPEAVTALRFFAHAIEADPWEITPYEYRSRYHHPAVPSRRDGVCDDCGQPLNDDIHFPIGAETP